MIKKTFFYIFMLSCMIFLVELFSFVIVQLIDNDDYFDSRDVVFARLSEDRLAEFKKMSGDAVTGWHWKGSRYRQAENCLGEVIEYHHDAAGARRHPWFDVRNTRIVVVGDSYTNGDEIGDSKAFPAQLSEQLGVSVANHGVGGYGPTQSLLNLQEKISRYPELKVVVLAITYENLHRMVNSYRPVLHTQSGEYTFKPYMSGGHIVSHPGSQIFDGLEIFKQTAIKSFDNDFWAKPVVGFPYSVAIGKSLASNYFYYRRLQRVLALAGKPEYFMTVQSDEIKLNLIALLNQFASMARGRGVQPIAIFIPRNLHDTSSLSRFITQNRADIDSRLLVGDVARHEGVDWAKFNLQEEGGNNLCHPSPYGYRVIAEYIAEFMRKNDIRLSP